MTHDTRPAVGSTGTLAELQVQPGDVVQYHFPDMNPGCLRTVENVTSCGYHMTDSIHLVVNDHYWTLISRATPQPTQTVTTNGRHYDLTALESPFGLLPEPVQVALKAWPHGVQRYMTNCLGRGSWSQWSGYLSASCVVRAKPAPVETRVMCYRGVTGSGGKQEYGTCIERDGEILWDTWEPYE